MSRIRSASSRGTERASAFALQAAGRRSAEEEEKDDAAPSVEAVTTLPQLDAALRASLRDATDAASPPSE